MKNPITPIGWMVISGLAAIVLIYSANRVDESRRARQPTSFPWVEAQNPTSQPASVPDVMGLPMPTGDKLYTAAAIEIYRRESSLGLDPKARPGVIGPDGERGPFQVRPIWYRDIKQLFGEEVDPDDTNRTWWQVWRWLEYYGPRVGATTVDDLYEMYRRGPTGYEEWKNERKN